MNQTYEELEEFIADLPPTWVPGILVTVAEVAIKKKVFKVGGMAKIVNKAEERLSQPQDQSGALAALMLSGAKVAIDLPADPLPFASFTHAATRGIIESAWKFPQVQRRQALESLIDSALDSRDEEIKQLRFARALGMEEAAKIAERHRDTGKGVITSQMARAIREAAKQ